MQTDVNKILQYSVLSPKYIEEQNRQEVCSTFVQSWGIEKEDPLTREEVRAGRRGVGSQKNVSTTLGLSNCWSTRGNLHRRVCKGLRLGFLTAEPTLPIP